MTEFGRGRDQTLSTMGRDDLTAMSGTIFTSIHASKPFDFMPLDDVDTFIEGLRHFHANKFVSKHDNALVSPAIFDPSLFEETQRGLNNIRAVWGVWLDNDGGDLSADAFARLFPRLRMAIFNSYSSTPAVPRWRVFIPTTIALSIRAYKAVVGEIFNTVNKAGYWSAEQLADGRVRKSTLRHGFDMSKLVPSSLFYLPCQAKDPAGSFFADYSDTSRTALDPHQWVAAAANRTRPEPEVLPSTITPPSVGLGGLDTNRLSPAMRALRDQLRADLAASPHDWKSERREAAIAAWRSTPKGHGNHAFYMLACTLAGLGLSHQEIRATLLQEAAHAHSPTDRRQQIPSIMDTLSKRPPKLAA